MFSDEKIKNSLENSIIFLKVIDRGMIGKGDSSIEKRSIQE